MKTIKSLAIGLAFLAGAGSVQAAQGFTLECDADEAKRRLNVVAEAGFDHIVLVVNDASEENLVAIRAIAD